jgi:putative ABC transport system permease protein
MLASMQGIVDQLGDTMQMAGVGIGLVAGFMVFNAFLMSITQRRQQIGALRALGMTRGQVMRLVLGEALLTAIIGTIVGVIAGPLMGYGVIEVARVALAGVFAFEPGSPAASSVAVAVAVGIGITLLAVAIPAAGSGPAGRAAREP